MTSPTNEQQRVDVPLSTFARLCAERGIAIYPKQSFPKDEPQVEAPSSWKRARKRDSEMYQVVLGIGVEP